MMFGTGSAWCNPRSGFSDGHIIKFDKSLTVQMDRPMQLAMQSSGAGMEDFQLFVQTITPEVALPPPTFSGDGSMEVQRQANGHFYLPGSVANVPVTFMVDTGASVTSISSDIARQAGIHNCKEVQFQTANGQATGCVALVPRMTLGNFVVGEHHRRGDAQHGDQSARRECAAQFSSEPERQQHADRAALGQGQK